MGGVVGVCGSAQQVSTASGRIFLAVSSSKKASLHTLASFLDLLDLSDHDRSVISWPHHTYKNRGHTPVVLVLDKFEAKQIHSEPPKYSHYPGVLVLYKARILFSTLATHAPRCS